MILILSQSQALSPYHGDRNVARGEDDQAGVGGGGGEEISVVITEVNQVMVRAFGKIG